MCSPIVILKSIVFDQLMFDFTNIHYLKVENKTFKICFVKINNLHLRPIGSKQEILNFFHHGNKRHKTKAKN